MKKSVQYCLLTLVVILSVAVISNPVFAGKNQFEKEVDKEASAVKLVQEVVRGEYNVIKTVDLKRWVDEKKEMVVIDTMPYESSYKKNHIPGAKQFLFPIPEMDQWDKTKTDGKTEVDFKKVLGNNMNKTVIVYCGFVKCTRSHNGAMWAKKLGYKNVYRHPGGIFAWKGAGFRTESVK